LAKSKAKTRLAKKWDAPGGKRGWKIPLTSPTEVASIRPAPRKLIAVRSGIIIWQTTNTIMKKLFSSSSARMLAALVAGFFGTLNLQGSTDTEAPPYYPYNTQLGVGLTGLGGEFTWRFMDHLGAGIGASGLTYSRQGTMEGVDFNARLRLLTAPLTVAYYPWTAHSFRLNLGAAYNDNQLTGQATGSTTLQGTPYTGTLNLRLRQEPVDPYFSLAGNLFYFDRRHHWAMAGELGGFYTGKPRVDLTGSPSSPAIATEQQKLVHYARQVQYWPVLTLGVAYSF
jgi:hypothetical protein